MILSIFATVNSLALVTCRLINQRSFATVTDIKLPLLGVLATYIVATATRYRVRIIASTFPAKFTGFFAL